MNTHKLNKGLKNRTDADICVFACTGSSGGDVARGLVELADTPTTLLLAGRNVANVRFVQEELLKIQNDNVKIMVHSEAVDVSDDDALQALVLRARVVVNCIAVDSHPRALEGMAEACAKAGVHYLDLATQREHFAPLFELKPSGASRIIPACGFDYAFMDVAMSQAERAFSERYNGVLPNKVQLTLAVHTGPLGMKFPLDLVDSYLHAKPKPRPLSSSRVPVQRPTRQSSSAFLAYIKALSSWSIPWPLGGDSTTFLLSRRQWSSTNVDARLALPQSLWRGAGLLVYAAVVAAIFIPLLIAARFLRIEMLHRCLLWLLPTVTLGFLCDDKELRRRANIENRVELVIVLRNDKGQELCCHVKGPSPTLLNQLCLVFAALELVKLTDGEGGALTPAQALCETDFWYRLQNAGELKLQISGSDT